MKRILSTIFPVILLTLIFSGCAKKEDANNKVLAKVSHKVITSNDIKKRIAKMPPYYQNIINKNPKKYVEDVIVEMLCYEEGVRKGIDRDKEVKEVMNEAKKKIVMAKLIKNEVEDKIVITDTEAKKFYDEHKDEFKTPEMWRASHILVSDEKEAKAILDQLAQGASFEEMAKTKSIDATANRGGDVGFFRKGQLVPEFEKACLALKKGETSKVVQSQFGYHIIKMTDYKAPSVKSYDEAKRAIEAELKRSKRGELFSALVIRLKDKYGVEINESAFPQEKAATKEKVPAA